MAFTYDQIFAVDPSNTSRVASNGAITIYAPGDPTKTPITITSVSGAPLANPIQVNELGFGPAFMHATLDRVAWSGGGMEGLFTSYEGLKNVALDAQAAAAEVLRRVTSGEATPTSGLVPVYEINGAYTRPDTSTKVSYIFTGYSDPGAVALENDRWEKLT